MLFAKIVIKFKKQQKLSHNFLLQMYFISYPLWRSYKSLYCHSFWFYYYHLFFLTFKLSCIRLSDKVFTPLS